MHPFNHFLPRLFPVILVLGAAALIAQLVLEEPDESEGDANGGSGGDPSEGSEGSEGGGGSAETAGPEEGFQPS